MNGKQNRLTSYLYDLAHDLDNNCKFKHSAIITQGSKILSCGVNNGYRTKWGKTIKCCLHAEIAAINDFNKKNPDFKKFNKLSIWVSCINKNEKSDQLFRESKPCKECITEIVKYGFKKLHFSNSDGTFTQCKPVNINTELFYQTNAQILYH